MILRRLGYAILALIPLAYGCDSKATSSPPPTPPPPPTPVVVTSITIEPAKDSVLVLDARQFAATARTNVGTRLTDTTFLWSSSDTSIATVDAHGLVTTKRLGFVIIRAQLDTIRGEAVLIAKPRPPIFQVRSNATLRFGERISLDSLVTYRDSAGRYVPARPLAVTTSDSTLLRLQDLYVLGRGAGSGNLTISLGSLSGQSAITVLPMSFRSAGAGCGVAADNAAYCWGDAQIAGELGDGQQGASSTDQPLRVVGGLQFKSVVGHHYTFCGITLDDLVYCWGYNALGQLGAGNRDQVCFTGGLGFGWCSPEPVPVVGGLRFKMLAAGAAHVCGLTFDGSAYCWGSNEGGQLGIVSDSVCPLNVSGPPFTPVPCNTRPVAVSGGLHFQTISAGALHTCGVTAGGAAYCWGSNEVGQLGIGVEGGPETCTRIADPRPLPCSHHPMQVVGGIVFKAISAGSFNTCGIDQGGDAYCFGIGEGLGHVPVNPTSSTVPVPVSGGLHFTSVATGISSSCALTTDQTAYCWGRNSFGELGTGSTASALAPVAVIGGLRFETMDMTSQNSVCGFTTAGEVYCWGNGVIFGQAYGTVRPTPTRVRTR